MSRFASRRGRIALSAVALLLVAAVLGLVFADLLTKPAKSGNAVATKGAAVAVTTTTALAAQGQVAAQPAAQPVETAAQEVATTVQAGLANATIRRGAGRLLMDQLTPLLGKPYARTRQIQRFDGFAQMVYNDLTRGAIKGSATTDALASGVATLAFALETPVPYPSLTATTVHPPKAVHKARKVNSLRKRASGKKVHSGKKLASAKKVASGQKVHSGKKLASGHKVRSGGRALRARSSASPRGRNRAPGPRRARPQPQPGPRPRQRWRRRCP